jgi:hypothetical protein
MTSPPVPPAPDDAYAIRKENEAAAGDYKEWFEYRLRLHVRRGWPTQLGWTMIAFVVVFGLALGAAPLLSNKLRNPQGLFALFGLATVLIGPFVLAFLGLPCRSPETADWTLTVSPTQIQFDNYCRADGTTSHVIRREEAGSLEVVFVPYSGRSVFPPGILPGKNFVSATGTSIDRSSKIFLTSLSVSTGGLLGHFRRQDLAAVLVSWWPANSLSVAALREYEKEFNDYWDPYKVPTRDRTDLGNG